MCERLFTTHVYTYMHVFVYSCLAGLRVLQKNGHLPTDASLFREYARFYAVCNTHTPSLLSVYTCYTYTASLLSVYNILVVHTVLVFSHSMQYIHTLLL